MEDDNRDQGEIETRSETGVLSAPINWSAQALNLHAVQCFRCGKYRRVPEKGKYEEIRERILSSPWECEFASQWTSEKISCDLPDEFASRDYVLIFDMPAIPPSPPRWERRCYLRRQCSTRFADVYYHPPNSGERIKTKREIIRYGEKFPGSLPLDFDVARQTSFATPRAPPGLWIRKKTTKVRKDYKHHKLSEKKAVSRTANDGKCHMEEALVRGCKEEKEECSDCELKVISALGEKVEGTLLTEADSPCRGFAHLSTVHDDERPEGHESPKSSGLQSPSEGILHAVRQFNKLSATARINR